MLQTPNHFTKALIAATILFTAAGASYAQQLYVGSRNSVGEYNLNGTPVNASLVTGLSNTYGLASDSNGNLFIPSYSGAIGMYSTSTSTYTPTLFTAASGTRNLLVSGTDLYTFSGNIVGKYTTSGATVNASFISSGISSAWGGVVIGSNLFISNGSVVSEFTTSGTVVNLSLITGLSLGSGIAASGTNLFVASSSTAISEYDTSGNLIQANFITGLNGPNGIYVSGSDLYVANTGSNTVGEYTVGGATVNAALISGISSPEGLTIAPAPGTVPEPSACVMLALAGAAFVGMTRRRKRAVV